jgi:hypothetical protein
LKTRIGGSTLVRIMAIIQMISSSEVSSLPRLGTFRMTPQSLHALMNAVSRSALALPLSAHTGVDRLVQQRRHRSVAVPAIVRRQFDDVRRQTIFIRAASRNLALCRAVLAKRAASAALRYAKRLPHGTRASISARNCSRRVTFFFNTS